MSRPAGLVSQSLVILRKDLTLEWRNRARVVAVVLFGVLILLLFSLALGPDTRILQQAAGGCLILALLLSSTLSLQESFRTEDDDEALEGLLLLPAEPAAIFYGKALANTFFLAALAPVLVPVTTLIYHVSLGPVEILQIVGLWLAAAAGLAAPGTLYAGLTTRLKSQDVLMPLLLFPLEVPVLLATVKAFGLVFDGDPMGQLWSWTQLILAFDVIYWCLCGVLFRFVVEEAA